MTSTPAPARPPFPAGGLLRHVRAAHASAVQIASHPLAHDALGLFMRLTIAGVFWRSLLTKVDTFGVWRYVELINNFEVQKFHIRLPELPLTLRPSTLTQFRNDFALPLLPPELAAWFATLGEFVLPILLVLGLWTRLAAAGLLAMTLVIQIFVFPDAWWQTHALWAAMLAYVLLHGPGRASADFWAGKAADHLVGRN